MTNVTRAKAVLEAVRDETLTAKQVTDIVALFSGPEVTGSEAKAGEFLAMCETLINDYAIRAAENRKRVEITTGLDEAIRAAGEAAKGLVRRPVVVE